MKLTLAHIYVYDFLCLKRNWISFSGQVAAAADVLKLTTREVCAATGRPSKVVFLQWKPWFFFCIAFRRLWDWDFHYRWNFGRFSTSTEWIYFLYFRICVVQDLISVPTCEIKLKLFFSVSIMVHAKMNKNLLFVLVMEHCWWSYLKSRIYVSYLEDLIESPSKKSWYRLPEGFRDFYEVAWSSKRILSLVID